MEMFTARGESRVGGEGKYVSPWKLMSLHWAGDIVVLAFYNWDR